MDPAKRKAPPFPHQILRGIDALRARIDSYYVDTSGVINANDVNEGSRARNSHKPCLPKSCGHEKAKHVNFSEPLWLHGDARFPPPTHPVLTKMFETLQLGHPDFWPRAPMPGDATERSDNPDEAKVQWDARKLLDYLSEAQNALQKTGYTSAVMGRYRGRDLRIQRKPIPNIPGYSFGCPLFHINQQLGERDRVFGRDGERQMAFGACFLSSVPFPQNSQSLLHGELAWALFLMGRCLDFPFEQNLNGRETASSVAPVTTILTIAQDKKDHNKLCARVIRASLDCIPQRRTVNGISYTNLRVQIGQTVDFSDIHNCRHWKAKDEEMQDFQEKVKIVFSYILCPGMQERWAPLYVDPLARSILMKGDQVRLEMLTREVEVTKAAIKKAFVWEPVVWKNRPGLFLPEGEGQVPVSSRYPSLIVAGEGGSEEAASQKRKGEDQLEGGGPESKGQKTEGGSGGG